MMYSCKVIINESMIFGHLFTFKITLRSLFLTIPLLMIISDFCILPIYCAAKGGNLDECVNTNVLCYDCDSRFDQNCADPFGEASGELSASSTPIPSVASTPTTTINNDNNPVDQLSTISNFSALFSQNNNSSSNYLRNKKHRHLPPVQVCHGCCVKLTSKLTNGVSYVRRMCITNLSINYFMVGLICMKETGDRGKLCFCETDYCNGQGSRYKPNNFYISLVIMFVLIVITTKSYRIR